MTTDAELERIARSAGATRLVVSSIFGDSLGDFVGRHPDRFQRIYANGAFEVFRVVSPASAQRVEASLRMRSSQYGKNSFSVSQLCS